MTDPNMGHQIAEGVKELTRVSKAKRGNQIILNYTFTRYDGHTFIIPQSIEMTPDMDEGQKEVVVEIGNLSKIEYKIGEPIGLNYRLISGSPAGFQVIFIDLETNDQRPGGRAEYNGGNIIPIFTRLTSEIGFKRGNYAVIIVGLDEKGEIIQNSRCRSVRFAITEGGGSGGASVGRDGESKQTEGDKKTKTKSRPARFDLKINEKESTIEGDQPKGLNLKWKDKGNFVIKNGGGGTLSWKAAPTLYKFGGKQIIILSRYYGSLSGGEEQLIEVSVDRLLLNKKIEAEGKIYPAYIIVTAARGGFGGLFNFRELFNFGELFKKVLDRFFKKAIGRVRIVITL
jgi:hypothetical protein